MKGIKRRHRHARFTVQKTASDYFARGDGRDVAAAIHQFGIEAAGKSTPKTFKPDFVYHYSPTKSASSRNPAPTNSEEVESAPAPKISREQAEAWLAKHNRNAMSLLAAFRAMGDTNYLNEAATNFPNDPHVELAVLSRDEFPAERRKWLDLFKQSSPSNSLANYLSAEDDFKNGKSDEAMQELLAASGKSQFEMFETESRLDGQDLYLSSGQSELASLENSRLDFSGETIKSLADFRLLAQSIGDLQKQYVDANDPNSVANLAALGMSLANQLQTGDGSKLLVNQLVGSGEERLFISKLDQNTSYDFLDGKTPDQVVQDLKRQKILWVQTVKSFDSIYPTLPDSEKISFQNRENVFGEPTAMQWLFQQHPPANPTK